MRSARLWDSAYGKRRALKQPALRLLVFDCEFAGDMCGAMDTQLFEEFFRSFAFNAGITLHVACPYGANDHHKAEAMFKALARALRQATEIDPRFEGEIVSTKGSL